MIIEYLNFSTDCIIALGPLALAGINAAAQVAANYASNLISSGQSEKETKRQYTWNKYQNTYLHKWQLEDRDNQRAYDHPLAERNRWSMAGYNPQSVFGQFSQSQPVAFGGSGNVGVTIPPAQTPIDTAALLKLQSEIEYNEAAAAKEQATEEAIRGTESRNQEMQPYMVRYQDALNNLTNDRNHREEVQQQMEADMDAATRNKMQADIDSAVEALRLQDEKQKEDARHNLETEVLARYEAETNRKNAVTNAAKVAQDIKESNARIGKLKQETKRLQDEHKLEFGTNAVDFILSNTDYKLLPGNMKQYVVKVGSQHRLRMTYAQYNQIHESAQKKFETDVKRINSEYNEQQIYMRYINAIGNLLKSTDDIDFSNKSKSTVVLRKAVTKGK